MAQIAVLLLFAAIGIRGGDRKARNAGLSRESFDRKGTYK